MLIISFDVLARFIISVDVVACSDITLNRFFSTRQKAGILATKFSAFRLQHKLVLQIEQLLSDEAKRMALPGQVQHYLYFALPPKKTATDASMVETSLLSLVTMVLFGGGTTTTSKRKSIV